MAGNDPALDFDGLLAKYQALQNDIAADESNLNQVLNFTLSHIRQYLRVYGDSYCCHIGALQRDNCSSFAPLGSALTLGL